MVPSVVLERSFSETSFPTLTLAQGRHGSAQWSHFSLYDKLADSSAVRVALDAWLYVSSPTLAPGSRGLEGPSKIYLSCPYLCRDAEHTQPPVSPVEHLIFRSKVK